MIRCFSSRHIVNFSNTYITCVAGQFIHGLLPKRAKVDYPIYLYLLLFLPNLDKKSNEYEHLHNILIVQCTQKEFCLRIPK